MFYFKWRGINSFGKLCSGKNFSFTAATLKQFLQKQNVSLVSFKKINSWFSFFYPIFLSEKIYFFQQLSLLLAAGVRLPESLIIVSTLTKNIRLQKIIMLIHYDVSSGFSLSDALKNFPDIFDVVAIKMIEVGQETGKLSKALEQLGSYLHVKNVFYKKLKTAALLPIITFVFFIIITAVLFTVIVPKFAVMFASMNAELPVLTKYVLAMSVFIKKYGFFFLGGLLLVIAVVIYSIFKKKFGIKFIDLALVKMPLVGSLIKQSSLVYFLQSLSILLQNGICLLPAVTIARTIIGNLYLQNALIFLEKDIDAGMQLSDAMSRVSINFFEQDLIAMVRIGQESAKMGFILSKAAQFYQDKADHSIAFFTTVFQPLLMIVLGLLIMLLIFAIYIPVFTLSKIV